MEIFEVIFDITYLVGVIFLSSIIIRNGKSKKDTSIILFGLMGLLLGFGDAFHLVPRILAHLTTGMEDYAVYLGVGKLITGITMTVFYYLIYQVFSKRTNHSSKIYHIVILLLIVLRFILLALPGNEWTLNSNNLTYGIIRNIPFALLGVLIVYLFIKSKISPFNKMGLWIIVSFICYSIVVIGSGFIPALGAFMMPKTIAYFIIIYLGYKELK